MTKDDNDGKNDKNNKDNKLVNDNIKKINLWVICMSFFNDWLILDLVTMLLKKVAKTNTNFFL